MSRFEFHPAGPLRQPQTALKADAAAARLRALRLKHALRLAFDPDQPRVPEGNPDGGQWTDGGGGAGGGSGQRQSGQPKARRKVVAPIDHPISMQEADQLERELGYSADGPSQNDHALRHPLSALTANDDAAQARTDSEVRVSATGHPDQDGHNDERDAFRHADWSLRMTRNLGAERAKEFGDAHERYDTRQSRGERLMDLINNHIGRSLASQPGLPPDIVARALYKGLLQTRPVEIR